MDTDQDSQALASTFTEKAPDMDFDFDIEDTVQDTDNNQGHPSEQAMDEHATHNEPDSNQELPGGESEQESQTLDISGEVNSAYEDEDGDRFDEQYEEEDEDGDRNDEQHEEDEEAMPVSAIDARINLILNLTTLNRLLVFLKKWIFQLVRVTSR